MKVADNSPSPLDGIFLLESVRQINIVHGKSFENGFLGAPVDSELFISSRHLPSDEISSSESACSTALKSCQGIQCRLPRLQFREG